VVDNYNNLKKLVAQLDSLTDDLIDGKAKDIQAAAKRFVHVKTGSLKRSIRVNKIEGGYEVSAESEEGGAHREYAEYQEFGTSVMHPRPFMIPGYEAGRHNPERDAKFGQDIERIANGG
jgi:HK97 gp10 family phage protein